MITINVRPQVYWFHINLFRAFFLAVVGSGCPPGKKTDNQQGACCVFPFTYMGKTFHSCTKYNWHRLWCALTATYNGTWANCGEEEYVKLTDFSFKRFPIECRKPKFKVSTSTDQNKEK